jgi:DNA-directed RNA polymerase specialized sigma24 family protein
MALEGPVGSNLGEVCLFRTVRDVVRALITYTDWWQPYTSSVLQVGGARRTSGFGDGIREGLLDTVGERSELSRRILALEERDRRILVLWYVGQLPADEVAKEVGISRRHCFRRRSAALRALVDDDDQQVA